MIRSFADRLQTLRPRWAAMLLILVTLALYLPGQASLPPMDRDEPRFAQASKQMLETGDLVDIRYQDEARNKKPVGIYWLQAIAVAAGEAAGVADARRTIWLYRLPSLLGAITAVLATYWTALAVTTRRSAFVAALLFGSTVILTVESHLAKTDAVLCATVVFAMGGLLRLYLARKAGDADWKPAWAMPAVFWTAIGVGILIKGPITPMVVALAIAVLCVKDRSARWLATLRPGLGLVWVAILVLPWLVMILIKTNGTFFSDSVGHDMLGKVTGVQDAHGAPPGTYFLAFWATAWPMAPFAAAAAWSAWKRHREQASAFLLAWIIPTWLLFEAVPTKLPHYVMPVYPAIAILTAMMLDDLAQPRLRSRPVAAVFLGLLGLLPVALVVVLFGGQGVLWTRLAPPSWVAGMVATAVMLGCVVGAFMCFRRGQFGEAVLAAALAALVLNLFVLGHLLASSTSDLLAMSGRLAATGREVADPDCSETIYASAGDHEPSLVFLTGTKLLLTNAEGAADFLKGGDCRAAFVESRLEPAFQAVLANAPGARLARRMAGTNINGGKHLDIAIYVRQKARP